MRMRNARNWLRIEDLITAKMVNKEYEEIGDKNGVVEWSRKKRVVSNRTYDEIVRMENRGFLYHLYNFLLLGFPGRFEIALFYECEYENVFRGITPYKEEIK